jgi:hypothetical protein
VNYEVDLNIVCYQNVKDGICAMYKHFIHLNNLYTDTVYWNLSKVFM